MIPTKERHEINNLEASEKDHITCTVSIEATSLPKKMVLQVEVTKTT